MSESNNKAALIVPDQIERKTRVRMSRVLLVEDNPTDARLLQVLLGKGDFRVELETTSNLATAIELLRALSFDAVLLDLSLPDSNGLDTLRKVLAVAQETALVVLTGIDDERVADEAVKLGAQSYLVKGEYNGQLLLRTLRHANERQKLVTQLVNEISLRCELQQILERGNRDLEKRIEMRTAELHRVNRALSMLTQCIRAILHGKTEDKMFHNICQLVVGPGAYPLAWIGSIDPEHGRISGLEAYASENREYLQGLREKWEEMLEDFALTSPVLYSGEYVIEKIFNLYGPVKPWQQFMQGFKFTGSIVLPLLVQEKITGVMVIYSRKPAAFDENEIELLQEMSVDLSFGISVLRTNVEREKERAELVKFSTALKQTDDIVMITDKQGIIDYVNPAFERVSGFSVEEAQGRTPGSLVIGDEDTRGNYTEMWQVLMRGEPYRGTFINRRRDGGIYYEQKTITPIKDNQGKVSYYLSTGKDITVDLQLQERLRALLNYDGLTGLPNRSLFLDRLNHFHEQAQWEQRQLAIIIINVDRFKVINSSLGHKLGDEVLRLIATRLKEYFRPVDVVGRLVGNTFAVILADQTDIEHIVDITRKLLEFIAIPNFILNREIMVSACVGVALARHDISDPAELLRNAEAAMYQAKLRGPNQIEFYNKSINEHSAYTLAMEVALRHALERREFILYYQQQIDIATDRIVGLEALIRWQHPLYGIISPAEFIPLLEQTGLIVPVGQWVLEEACRQLWEWDRIGLPHLRMGLNLSPKQILYDRLIEDFSGFFEKHGMDKIAGLLELEITESSFMHDLEHGIKTLQKFKEQGLRIAIDDFGTGYSSLSYLSRLPVDVLKIDRAFINNIPGRDDDVEVVRAIIALAKSLNLDVIAEGVENTAQRDFLVKHGCDFAQGFYYSEPQSAKELTPYLRQCGINGGGYKRQDI